MINKIFARLLLNSLFVSSLAVTANVYAKPALTTGPGISSQYDTTHVYVNPEYFDKFTDSLIATFGGHKSKQGVFQATPTASQTMSQLVLTPVGSVSVFGFKTPVPYPFGKERTGYLVTDIDQAVKEAKVHGADVIVDTFPDPVGRDAIIQWPGGVNMQLYWHFTKPSYDKLETIPENRVYVSPVKANEFIKKFVAFSHGKVISDNPKAAGGEIGRPNDSYRRVEIESPFGKMLVLVTDGHLPYPYGYEMTGYEVKNLDETLQKAKNAGAKVLVDPVTVNARQTTVVEFPGGYIAEIHAKAQ